MTLENDLGTPKCRGALCGLGAAALFGVSTPFAKLLLPQSSPLALAALLYIGAAGALIAFGIFRRSSRVVSEEAPLQRSDIPPLLGIAVAGGVLAPVLMLYGLSRVSAVAASLLLNLEAPLTILIAVGVFREHLGSREWLAAGLIVAGAATLSGGLGGLGGQAVGIVALAAACACWAVDNNLTQRLSLRDPIAVVRLKTLVAGSANLVLAVAVGAQFPSPAECGAALVLGAVSYGVSIVLDAYALRLIGAAREAAYFATAPFFGVLVAVILLGDDLGASGTLAAFLIALGVFVLVRQRHEHEHDHELLEHEHVHVHDEHHQHPHGESASSESHAHRHTHGPLRHMHAHLSDAHHRHPH